MKKTLFFTLMLGITTLGFAQSEPGTVIFEEDFNNMTTISGYLRNLPDGWTTYEDNNANYSDYSNWGKSWVGLNYDDVLGGVAGCCTYFTSETAAADRWLVTPAISITEGGLYLNFKAITANPNYPDRLEVKVSTGSSAKADFTNTLMPVTTIDDGDIEEYMLDMTAYAGQTVYIAFVCTSVNAVYLLVDDVKVLKPYSNGIELSAFATPNYAPAGQSINITGTIINKGINPLQSYDVVYTANGEQSATFTVSGINVAYNGTHTFTHNVPYTVALGLNEISVSVSNPNGDNTIVAAPIESSCIGYDPASTTARTVLLENFTTAKCPNCPGAHERIGAALEGRNDVVMLAHHVGYYTDNMTLAASNEMLRFYAAGGGTYAPAVMLDRTRFGEGRGFDPTEMGPIFFPDGDIAYAINTATEVPAFVSVGISNFSYDANTRTVSGTVSGQFTSTMDMSDPRVSIYLTEDSIIASQSGATSRYRHDHVIRACITDIWGDDAVINSTEAGSTFSTNFSYTLPSKFKAHQCKVIAFVSNYDAVDVNNCQIANTEVANVTSNYDVAIGEVEDNLKCNLYPNPTSDRVFIESDATMQSVKVYNTLGQIVYSNDKVNANSIELNTNSYAAGTYIVTISSNNGMATRRINVVK